MGEATDVTTSFRACTAVVLVLSAILGGCVSYGELSISRPSVTGEGATVTGKGKVTLDQAVLLVRPANAVWRRTCLQVLFFNISCTQHPGQTELTYYSGNTPNFFVVEVAVFPRRDGVTFNPTRTGILFDGKILHPVAYQQLEPAYSSDRLSSFWLKYNETYCVTKDVPNLLTGLSAKDARVPIPSAGRCFALKFDIAPPAPNRTFALEMGGLEVRSELINVPRIIFVPDVYGRRRI